MQIKSAQQARLSAAFPLSIRAKIIIVIKNGLSSIVASQKSVLRPAQHKLFDSCVLFFCFELKKHINATMLQTKTGLIVTGKETAKMDRKTDTGETSEMVEKTSAKKDEKELKKTNKKLHIVLDIDGTLMSHAFIDKPHSNGKSSSGAFFYYRPGLISFLDYCVEHCASVSIWTAACKEWMHDFIQSLPVRFHKIFLFTWHVNRCTYTVRRTGLMKTRMFILKRLSKVWKKKWAQKAAMNRHNTIIVEDTPSNCLDNYGNAIYVPAYRWCVEQEDTILPRLQTYLTDLATKKSVRSIEKRGWISE